MRYESELGTAQYRGQLLVVHEMPMQTHSHVNYLGMGM